MIKKPTVTIGIPAHNEEKNIAALLDSILKQRRQTYILESIIIATDGCTDGTVRVVKKYQKKNRLIKLVDDGKRLGLAGRLNLFVRLNKSDFIINFDADTVLGHERTVEEIVKGFEGKKVG